MEIILALIAIATGLVIVVIAAVFAHAFLGPPFDRADNWARSTRDISRSKRYRPP